MTTAGDATRILFVNRNLSDDYGAAIQATSTGSAPGFLNPRLDFLVQPTNTNALSSLAIAASLTGNKNLLVGGTSDVTGPGAIVAFGTNEATTGGDAAIISSGGIYSTKKIITASSLTTGAPTTGTAAPWKVGVSVTTTALVLSTTVYLQVDISGTLYKVATIQ